MKKAKKISEILQGNFTNRRASKPRKFYKQKDATPEIVYMIIKKRLPRIKNFDTSHFLQYKNYNVLCKLTTDELNNIRKRVLLLYNKQQLEDYKTNIINEMLEQQRKIISGEVPAEELKVPDLIY